MKHRGQQLFVAEHAAVQKAKDHRKHTAALQNSAERHFFELMQQPANDAHDEPLPQVAKHDTKQNRVGDRHKARRVDILVGGQAIHRNVHLKRAREPVILELRWGRNRCIGTRNRVRHLAAGALRQPLGDVFTLHLGHKAR
ncbi:hypothetical protein SDC9_172834 [bioreactor metagenome]|uniref:Uncharacterized protein n=1 Tax=bioreactor metagenome TaxID=1076179 RepID=A0A645GFG3_9ZZZZ